MSGRFKSNAVVGSRYGEWEVISEKHVIRNNRAYWWCKCSCGKTKFVEASTLLNKRSKSCGCKTHVKYSKFPGVNYKSSEYSVWEGMKRRCYNSKSRSYPNYGGRGITVCDRWHNFENFIEDMGLRPKGRSLDRINNDLGYFPANCRWATAEEQSLNKRTNHRLSFNNENLTIKEWSDKLGIPVTTIAKRIMSGFPIDKVLSQDRLDNREVDYANTLFMFKGKTKTLRQWAYDLGLNYSTIKSRYEYGIRDPEKLFAMESLKPGPKSGSKKPEGSGRGMSVSPGDRFGKLIIKSLFREKCGSQTITKAICVCDCGVEKIYSLSNVKSGKSVSCGCSKDQPYNKGVYSVYVGQQFDRLTVLSLFSENNISFALCKCICGTEKRVAVSNLKKGNTVSCGCKNRERMKTNNPGLHK